MTEHPSSVDQLIQRAVEGQLDEAGTTELISLMRQDPAVRKAFREQMQIHALLGWRKGKVASQRSTSY